MSKALFRGLGCITPDRFDKMRITDRNLHRLLALVAFGLYFIYLIRVSASSGKKPIKLQSQNVVHSKTETNRPIPDLTKEQVLEDVPQKVEEKQSIKISSDVQSAIKGNIGSSPAEVFGTIGCHLGENMLFMG